MLLKKWHQKPASPQRDVLLPAIDFAIASIVQGVSRVCPLKCPLLSGNPGPHITHGSLGARESALQTECRSEQPFCSAHQQTDS